MPRLLACGTQAVSLSLQALQWPLDALLGTLSPSSCCSAGIQLY